MVRGVPRASALMLSILTLSAPTGCGPSVVYVYPPEEHQAQYLERRHDWRVGHFEREQENAVRNDRYGKIFASIVLDEENLWRNEGKKPLMGDSPLSRVAPALPSLPPPRT